MDHLTLCAANRELIVLVGPSGCGKTTTLRLIAGLERPSGGVIRVGDCTVNDVPPRNRDVAMVFQNHALFPHMNVRGNLGFGLKMRSAPKAQMERAVDEVAAKLGLSPLLDRRPHQLSGGERQRTALGRAMVRKPKLFLLDEPLSNLDLSLRASMRAEIKLLQRELATTMVYVTHDQEEAMSLADRIGVLDFGRLQQYAPPMEIYNRPANRFVAGFFGSPPMNLLRGELQFEDGKVVCKCGGIRIHGLGSSDWVNNLAFREVFVGVRPHDVELAPPGETSDTHKADHYRGIVRVVEFLGDAAVVRIAIEGAEELVAKTGTENPPAVGEIVGVSLRPDKLHLFEANQAGQRLNWSEERNLVAT